MNLIIEKMNINHLEKIKDVLQTEFDEFWNENILKSELNNEYSEYIVATQNSQIVGFARNMEANR